MFEKVTESVQVVVHPSYVAEQSDPLRSRYFFAYQVTITNQRSAAIQLLSRIWIITDGHGHVEEVEGPGVVGLKPVIEPGKTFQYSSFCPLTTPTGKMRGIYRMTSKDGQNFSVDIPEFILCEPGQYH